jgi:hypothetical protein
VRVSTDKQAEFGMSLEAQTAECEKEIDEEPRQGGTGSLGGLARRLGKMDQRQPADYPELRGWHSYAKARDRCPQALEDRGILWTNGDTPSVMLDLSKAKV